MNDDLRGLYSINSQIKFKATMLKSILCDYSDAYIFVKGRITITGAGADAASRQVDERNKGVIFTNFASFSDCVSKINNTQVDKAKYLNVVMAMYNLINYSDNYLKTFGSLMEYYRDESHNTLTNFEFFKSIIKITGNTLAVGNTKNVVIAVLTLSTQIMQKCSSN